VLQWVVEDETNDNSCVLLQLQLGLEADVDSGSIAADPHCLSDSDVASAELIAHLANPSFFQRLRTEEQLLSG
jgi:hypothetical protein